MHTFEEASGNEIKKTKSFILWLGDLKNTNSTVFGVGSLLGSERCLGRCLELMNNKAALLSYNDVNWKRKLDDEENDDY